MFDRKEAIVTEEEDKEEEEYKIRNALSQCGYPKWAIEKVKNQMKENKNKTKGGKVDTKKEKSNGMVVIPYMQGVSERLQRVFKKVPNIQTAMKPTNTLKSVLVHPKDKINQ